MKFRMKEFKHGYFSEECSGNTFPANGIYSK